MKRLAVAFVSGLLFAIGLGVSGMTHPGKVLGFLDFAGDWDPSLLLVMGGGVIVNLIFFRSRCSRGAPLLAPSFSLPRDPRRRGPRAARRSSGSAGGWVASARGPRSSRPSTGAAPVVAFVVAMLASMALFDFVVARKPSGVVAEPEV